jgi:hypothetical protein
MTEKTWPEPKERRDDVLAADQNPGRHTGGVLVVLVARLVIILGLASDAYVHLRLAPDYDVVGQSLREGDLFRIEAILAVAAALFVLTGRRASLWFALVVAASAATALLVNTYWQVGAIGPIPDMYEPIWFAQKQQAAIGELAAAISAAALLLGSWLARRPHLLASRPDATMSARSEAHR